MTVFADNFNRADNADIGPVWDGQTGSDVAQIVSNAVRPTTFAVTIREIYSGFSTLDQHARLTLKTWSHATGRLFAGLLLRADPTLAANHYQSHAIRNLGNTTVIEKNVAGTPTNLAASTLETWAPTDTILFYCLGTRLETYRNGAVIPLVITDATFAGPGRAGMIVNINNAGAVSDIEVDDYLASDSIVNHRASIAGSGATTTSVTLVIPASTLVGDIVIASFTNGGATADPSVADNEGAGSPPWTKLLSGNNGTSNLSVWWKRASASTASKTITASGFTNSCTGVASVYSGCEPLDYPYGGQTYESNISGNETHAAITTPRDGCMVCLTVGQAPDTAIDTEAATSPAVLVERAEHLSTGGLDSAVAHASEMKMIAGSTGNLTWAQTNQASMSIAFYLVPVNRTVSGLFLSQAIKRSRVY